MFLLIRLHLLGKRILVSHFRLLNSQVGLVIGKLVDDLIQCHHLLCDDSSGFRLSLSKLLHKALFLVHQRSLALIDLRALVVLEGTQVHLQEIQLRLVLIHHILVRLLQLSLHRLLALSLLLYGRFLLYFSQDILDMNLLIVLALGGSLLQLGIQHTNLLGQLVTLLAIFLLFLTFQSKDAIALPLALLDVKSILRQKFLGNALGIVEFLASLTYQAAIVQQGAIRIHHLVGHTSNHHLAILVFLGPKTHIGVLLFKLLDLLPIEVEVDERILIAHRTDDGVLDEVGIQLGIEKHVLNGARDILVLGTLHNGIFAIRQEFLTAIVAEDDVTIHLITAHERGNRKLFAYLLSHLAPVTIHRMMLIHEPLAAERRIDETEHHSSLVLQGEHTVSSILSHHLIDDVRIGIRKVESIEGFFLLRDAQAQLVGIIKEQDGTEQGTLAHALGSDEMHIAIELYLGVWDVGTIQEYDFIQISHDFSSSSSVMEMQSINSSI